MNDWRWRRFANRVDLCEQLDYFTYDPEYAQNDEHFKEDELDGVQRAALDAGHRLFDATIWAESRNGVRDAATAALKQRGFNAIRLYTGADRHLLDCAHENGLLVLLGLPWEWSRDFLAEPRLRTEGELRLLEFLQEHGSHPALGALLVGVAPCRCAGRAGTRLTTKHWQQ